MVLSVDRARLARLEREEIQRQLDADAAKKVWQAGAGARALKAQELTEQRRLLKRKLVTDARSSMDWGYVAYTGHMSSSSVAEIMAAVESSFSQFCSQHPECDSAALASVRLFMQLHAPDADSTLVDNWNSALAYMENALSELDTPEETVSEPVSELTTEVKNPYPPFSRDAELWDRNNYEQSLANELGKPWNDAVADIERTSGLTLDTANRRWLFTKMQKSKLPFTTANIRKTAIKQWGESVGLTPEEKRELHETRAFEQLPSGDALKHLGIPKINTGAEPTGGYRAGRS